QKKCRPENNKPEDQLVEYYLRELSSNFRRKHGASDRQTSLPYKATDRLKSHQAEHRLRCGLRFCGAAPSAPVINRHSQPCTSVALLPGRFGRVAVSVRAANGARCRRAAGGPPARQRTLTSATSAAAPAPAAMSPPRHPAAWKN